MKLRLPRAALTAATFVALAASPLSAQRQAVHQGFWISFGFGAGYAFGDDALDGDSKFGGATFLRMGGSLSQQWLIGGEFIGWGAGLDDLHIGRGSLMFTALYYPSPQGGFYLKGGAGFSGRTVETTVLIDDAKFTNIEGTGGVGLGAGLGYDIQLARNFFLTPALDFVYTGTEGDTASLLLFTVGATWH